MPSVRQDAWTKDEDLFLAEVVLRHIREGSTQLRAFEEVGKALSRTAAACGFRWNSTVRKQYKAAIELAKKERKKLKKKQSTFQTSQEKQESLSPPGHKYSPSQGNITLDAVISFLQDYQRKEQELFQYFKNKEMLQQKLAEATDKISELERENEKLKNDYKSLHDDYLSVLAIMEKARKLTEQTEGGKDEESSATEEKNEEET